MFVGFNKLWMKVKHRSSKRKLSSLETEMAQLNILYIKELIM